MSTVVGPPRPPDLRLVPGALVVWAVLLLGIGLGPDLGAAATGLVVATGAATGVVAQRRGRSWLLAVAGCGLAAGIVCLGHDLVLIGHPVRVAAERAASATVRVVVDDDPRAVRHRGVVGQPQVVVPADLVWADVGAQRWRTAGRILLLAPAPSWSGLLPGQEVTAEGLLAPALRADLTVAVLRVRGPPGAVTAAPWWQQAAGAMRAGLRSAAAAELAPPEAGLLPGLAVGDTSGLADELDDDFRAAGLTHLVAVSGANLAILTGAVLWLLRRLRADPRLAAALGGVAVAGFVVLARPSPSVLRAAVMAAVLLVALGAGRGRAAVPALATAVLVLLLADPALAVDAGFALSVVATGALVLVAPGWTATLRRHRVPGWCAEAFAVSAAACVVTAPLIAGLSGQVSVIAVVANLAAAPAVAPATVLGVTAALLSPVAPGVAQACAWAAGPFVAWLVAVADRSAAVDGATVGWPAGIGGAVLLAAVIAGVVVAFRLRRVRALLLAVALGVALVLVPVRIAEPGWPPTGWVMVACDVGQGDALAVATGTPGEAVLVDTGPGDGPVDACLRRLGVRALAMLVITHLHADHIGGLAGALRGRPTGAVVVGPDRDPAWALQAVARAAAVAGVEPTTAQVGLRLVWPALTLEVIGPVHPATVVDGTNGTEVNNTSLVLRATTPVGTVLLTGDVELAAQADLLDSGVPLHADVLKLPHHGSRSTSAAFLRAVGARAVLVSVGAGNPYGHPNAPLLEMLERGGATVQRTDRSGDIAITAGADTDGDGRPDPAVAARGSPLPAPR